MAYINGITNFCLVSSNGTNLTQVQSTPQACMLCYCAMGNPSGNVRFLKIFDSATAPTVGVTTPIANFIIPGNLSGAGSNIPIPTTHPFAALQIVNGLWIAITAAIPLLDTTAINANDVTVNIGYINIQVPT
jgi:hypothetical protein